MPIKTIGIWLTIVVFFLVTIFPHPVFATNQQSTTTYFPTCDNTPLTMQLFIDFQNDALNLINNHPFSIEKATVGNLQSGLFSHGALKLPVNNTILNTITHAVNIPVKLVIQTVTTSVLLASNAIGGIVDRLVLFKKDRHIIRDRTKIMDLEWKISKTVYYIGSNDLLSKKIDDTTALKQLIDLYTKKGLFSSQNSFNHSISYATLLSFLSWQNIRIKYFLLWNEILTTKAINQRGIPVLMFSNDWVNQLQKDYLNIQCNTSVQQFITNITNIRSGFTKNIKNSTKTTTDAYNNFMQAIYGFGKKTSSGQKKESSSLTERELELIKNVYKIDLDHLSEKEKRVYIDLSTQTKNYFVNMKNNLFENSVFMGNQVNNTTQASSQANTQERKNNQDTISQLFKNIKNIINLQINNKQDREKQLLQNIAGENIAIINNLAHSREITTLLNNLQDSSSERYSAKDSFNFAMLEGLLRVGQEQERDYFFIKDTLPFGITMKFGELANTIKRINEVIGNKDSGLRKSLNLLCTIQASNKGTSGCYIP